MQCVLDVIRNQLGMLVMTYKDDMLNRGNKLMDRFQTNKNYWPQQLDFLVRVRLLPELLYSWETILSTCRMHASVTQ